jgi:hypothetical protein
VKRVIALALAALLSGCASLPPVQPWQKSVLARRDMALDPDPLASRAKAHMYQAKEAASGGADVGGGGCGCN